MILEDVQRALKAKALRDSLSRVEVTNPASELTTDSSSTKPSEDTRPSADPTPQPFPATPPKLSISISTRPSLSLHASSPKVSFPSYAHSPARSIESLSSSGFLRRTPLPVMVTSQNGTSCLDWSGVLVEHSMLEKELSLLGRTFSLTKRRSKAKDRIANLAGRDSLDFRESQGELHAGKSICSSQYLYDESRCLIITLFSQHHWIASDVQPGEILYLVLKRPKMNWDGGMHSLALINLQVNRNWTFWVLSSHVTT